MSRVEGTEVVKMCMYVYSFDGDSCWLALCTQAGGYV